MKCSRCDQQARTGQRLCKECHAANMREHRAARAGELDNLRALLTEQAQECAHLRSELAVARALLSAAGIPFESARRHGAPARAA